MKNKTAKKKLPRWLTVLIIILLVILLVGIALIVTRKILSKNTLSTTTYKVKSETYENVIDIAGVVSAAHEQTLQALSSGTVKAVYVKQGDSVKTGDVILQLDDSTEKYNLAKHDYEMETTRITGSAREYSLMKTQRAALVQKIAERKVTATFDGIIAAIDVAVGDSLEAKDEVGTLVDVSYLVADVEVAETDVSKLEIGQTVEFTFPAYDGKVGGYVVSWPAIGSVTSRGATVVKARVRIDEYPETILPNFSFSGKIKIAPDETYLLVSRYAVGRENKQAFVENARTGEKINVTVVPYDSTYVKIVEGNVPDGTVLKAQSEPQASGWNRQRAAPGARSGMGPGVMPRGMR